MMIYFSKNKYANSPTARYLQYCLKKTANGLSTEMNKFPFTVSFYSASAYSLFITLEMDENLERYYFAAVRMNIDKYFEFVRYFNSQNFGYVIDDSGNQDAYSVTVPIIKVQNTEKLLNKI